MEKINYTQIQNIIESTTKGESNLIANLSNICAILKEHLGHHWIGFYLVDGDELVLGPFQGPLACTRISFGKGVCGTAWKSMKLIRVDNVHEFSGHIACSSQTNSEIVIPLMKNNKVVAVLDIDSIKYSEFSEADELGLIRLSQYISTLF